MVRTRSGSHFQSCSNSSKSPGRSIKESFHISDTPPPLFSGGLHALNAVIIKRQVEIVAGARYDLLKVDDQHGALHYLAINLEDDDDLLLTIEIDGVKILNHTVDDLATTGVTRLGLEVSKAASGFLNVVRDAAQNAVIILNAAGDQLHWNKQCKIYVTNKGSATFDIQAAYILYHRIYD